MFWGLHLKQLINTKSNCFCTRNRRIRATSVSLLLPVFLRWWAFTRGHSKFQTDPSVTPCEVPVNKDSKSLADENKRSQAAAPDSLSIMQMDVKLSQQAIQPSGSFETCVAFFKSMPKPFTPEIKCKKHPGSIKTQIWSGCTFLLFTHLPANLGDFPNLLSIS